MRRLLIALGACALGVGAVVATAQAPTPAAQPRSGETYLWSGEFVSLDAGTRALTLRTRILSEAAPDVGRFTAGDRVLVTWSGLDIHAGAVRRVGRYDAAQPILDFFALPAELAARDVPNDVITLRIRIPEASVAAVKGLKPGAWVTVTARQRPKTDADAIVGVAAYIRSQT